MPPCGLKGGRIWDCPNTSRPKDDRYLRGSFLALPRLVQAALGLRTLFSPNGLTCRVDAFHELITGKHSNRLTPVVAMIELEQFRLNLSHLFLQAGHSFLQSGYFFFTHNSHAFPWSIPA